MKTNEVLENIKARRSVRAYTSQQVSEEDLQAILEAATYAPSGMHLETWHFTAIQNVDKLTELNERIKGAFAKSLPLLAFLIYDNRAPLHFRPPTEYLPQPNPIH